MVCDWHILKYIIKLKKVMYDDVVSTKAYNEDLFKQISTWFLILIRARVIYKKEGELLKLKPSNYRAIIFDCILCNLSIFNRFSSWSKLQRVIVGWLRFIQNAISSNKTFGALYIEKLKGSGELNVKNIQNADFQKSRS